jgi:hypothetical protein
MLKWLCYVSEAFLENHFVTIIFVQLESTHEARAIARLDSPGNKLLFPGFQGVSEGICEIDSIRELADFVTIMAEFVPFGGPKPAFSAN